MPTTIIEVKNSKNGAEILDLLFAIMENKVKITRIELTSEKATKEEPNNIIIWSEPI